MRAFLLIVVFFSLSYGIELLDKCDIRYKKCTFDCVQSYPLDEKKRKACEIKCKVEKGACKAKETAGKLKDKAKELFEGLKSKSEEDRGI